MPVDVVKIDRSYLSISTATFRELFRTMVDTVHAFGLPVVAEGSSTWTSSSCSEKPASNPRKASLWVDR